MNFYYRLLTSCFFAIIFPTTLATAGECDSLLNVLDKIVENKAEYENHYRARIERHLFRLNNATSQATQFAEYKTLFELYRKYKLDSALYYAQKKYELAKEIAPQDSTHLALMNIADGLKGLGRFHEAEHILDSIPKNEYIRTNQYFYYLRHSIAKSIYAEGVNQSERFNYAQRLRTCRDSITMVNQEGTVGYAVNQAEILKHEGKFKKACSLLESIPFQEVENNAIYWVSLAEIYRFLGNTIKEKTCLTRASIIDKRGCIKTYTSLQDLAMLLYKEGDVERAYRYITSALEDIIESNARSRLIHVAEYMPIITEAYKQRKLEERKLNTRYYFTFLLMSLVLIVLLIALVLRNRKLAEARAEVAAQNHRLTSLNNQLSLLNDDLNNINSRLSDSNKIKDEYLAQLFDTCSGYITEKEQFRLAMLRRIKLGQIDDILKMLEESIATSSLKDFFQKFDSIFLELFPSFIDEFNKLIQPSAQIVPKDGELLTPELRIYAMVRLGINDSTRIAGFLHYSSQTVYNYRQKVRNKAIVPKDKFLEKVQNLCR